VRRRLAGATRETFRSFRVRNFRLFFVGQGISQVGNWLTLIAQTLLVLELTGDGLAVGILTACQFGPILLMGAWTGLIADRWDKRQLLLIVQVGAMAQSFALGALAFMDDPPLAGIYALAVLGGVAMAFDNPARRAVVVEMVPDELVPNAVSLNSAMMTSSRVIGPALAGLLIATVGYGWAFVVDGISYAAVLVALWMIRTADLRAAPVTKRGEGQVREGLRYVRGVPELFIPLLMMAVVGTLTFNFQVVFPLMVLQEFGRSEEAFTVLFSVISAGSLVGALYTARRRTISVHDVVVASAFFGLAMLAFAAAPNLAWAFPLGVLVGMGSVAFLTASTSIVQMRAAPEMRGRVLALQAIVFLGSTPVGGPILGAVVDATNPRVGVLVGGVAACVAAVGGLLAYRRQGPAAEQPIPETEVMVPEPVA